MKNPVESKIEQLEALVRSIHDAAYSVLVESNGLSDNEWKTKDGTVYCPEWPVASFPVALRKLDAAYSAAKAYLEPEESERSQKWGDACATASYIMDRYREDRKAANEHPNLIESSLHRNIADAIYGTLKQTMEDRRAGKTPTTTTDKLHGLVARGELKRL